MAGRGPSLRSERLAGPHRHREDCLTMDRMPESALSTAPPVESSGPAAARSTLKGLVSTAASSTLAPLLRRFARDFVGGESLDEAWAVAERLQADGTPSTLGFWDDQTYAPADVVRIYRDTIERIGDGSLDSYISIKPPALRYDPAVARDLASAAAAKRVRIHVDSHGESAADPTWSFIEEMAGPLGPDLISLSVPGRWPRSVSDIDRAAELGIRVRIVKGQWPAETGQDQPFAAGFVSLLAAAAGRVNQLAIATHDPEVIRSCLTILRQRGTPCEQEFIMGVASNETMTLARNGGLPVRIYIPYGRGFIPNALGSLRRNPAMALHVMRRLLSFRSA